MRFLQSMQSSDPPTSWLSSSESVYPDSLNSNDESSQTISTRVEFIIGSPTRKRPFLPAPWAQYYDSIDAATCSDEYPPDDGEAMAECDSLECAEKIESDC